jgi:hypothetical protein
VGPWICWDFREMRICPTHYAIRADYLKSWVVEGSLDGSSWTEIDRTAQDFRVPGMSFRVSNGTECRFIRLTQTGDAFNSNDFVTIIAVEFFGTLSE